ncbi:MAG: outer membrane beta-barrel protein [Elusimicrobiota bacterium]|jgi:opacity protein-like surface antigen
MTEKPGRASENQLEFNLGRGFPSSSIQAGDRSDRVGARGTEWSANLLHHLAGKRAYWGLGGGQFRSNDNVSQTFVPNAFSTITSKATTVLVLLRTDLSAQSRFVPYFIGGLGWAQNSLSVVAVPNSTWTDTGTSESRKLLKDSKNTLGYAYGLGLDYALNDRLLIGVEARYQGSLKNTYEMTPAGAAATGQNSVRAPLNLFATSVKAGIKY